MDVKVETPTTEEDFENKAPTVFLAGTIDMGNSENWQEKFIRLLREANIPGEVMVYNPRRDDWDSSWEQDPTPGTQFRQQVDWELRHLMDASIKVFNFEPDSQSPITLMELGLCLAIDRHDPIFIRCPKEFYRHGNVLATVDNFTDLIYDKIIVVRDFDELMYEVISHLKRMRT